MTSPLESSVGIWFRNSWIANMDVRKEIKNTKIIKLSNPTALRNTVMMSSLVTEKARTMRYIRKTWKIVNPA
jgi:hypothetical protein